MASTRPPLPYFARRALTLAGLWTLALGLQCGAGGSDAHTTDPSAIDGGIDSSTVGCSSGACDAAAANDGGGGLVITQALALSSTTVAQGTTLSAAVTFENATSKPIFVKAFTIAARPPGGTNHGGPFDDLAPQPGDMTLLPGYTYVLNASRAFTTGDPTGDWYAYATYADAAGVYYDGPPVGFAVVPANGDASAAPPPAASAGYTTRTFGPALTIGTNWYPMNFEGIDPATVNTSQNADGSVAFAGSSGTFNAQLSTTSKTNSGALWKGTAFGGGGYFEATLSFTGTVTTDKGWVSWWSNGIEGMSGNGTSQWPNQPAGYWDDIEVDFMEFDTGPTSFGSGIQNWYGPSNAQVSTVNNAAQNIPAGTDLAQPHKYGALWVPATATAPGHLKFYFDGVEGPNTNTWSKYDPTLPPPPVDPGSAYSVIDVSHLSLLLGTGPNNPMTVYGVEVWQASAANNVTY